MLNKVKKKNLIVGMHPGCDLIDNLWSNKKWAKLAGALIKDYNATVILFRGPKEGMIIKNITRHMGVKAITFPQMNLRNYAALVSQCNYFFGVDSAPIHIAQAVGVPVIGLFVCSSPNMWFDYKRGVAVAKRNLEVSDVLKGFNILLSNSKVFCIITDKIQFIKS